MKKKDGRRDRPAWLDGTGRKYRSVPAAEGFDTIPLKYIQKLSDRYRNKRSDLVLFLDSIFDSETVTRLIAEYALGVMKDGSVVFPQIDSEGNARTAKVMAYDPETGHRDRSAGGVNWLHSIMIKHGYFKAYRLRQCLFGEHLLKRYPEKTVALVESEKTALICSGSMPEYLWLATGGLNGLNADKLSSLSGRNVVVFPDVDGYNKWCGIVASVSMEMSGLTIKVSDYLDRTASPEEWEEKIDIADRIVSKMREDIKGKGIEHCECVVSGSAECEERVPHVDDATVRAVRQYIDAEHLQEVMKIAKDMSLVAASISLIPDPDYQAQTE